MSVSPRQQPNFVPYSVIGTNLIDVRKRRLEHEPTPLKLELSWYLTPSETAKIDRDVLSRLSAKHQPGYGTLLVGGTETIGADRQHLPDRIQQQIPATWELPHDLWGYVFYASPLPPVTTFDRESYARGDRMVFNGDGMVHRFGFENGQATIKTRIMKTPCYYADLASQLLPKFKKFGYRFLDGGMVRQSLLIGSRNQLNTAFLPTKEHLLVTFDGARPHTIDPDSLEILEPVGDAADWTGLIPLPKPIDILFPAYSNPAHPLYDRLQTLSPLVPGSTDTIVTANYSAGLTMLSWVDRLRRWVKTRLAHRDKLLKDPWGAFTDLIRYRLSDRHLEKWQIVLPNGEPVIIEQALHQMALTEDYIIFGDIAFELEISQIFSPFVIKPIQKLSAQIGYWLSLIFLRLIPPAPYGNLYIIKRADLDRPIPPGMPPTLTAVKVVLPREVAHFVVNYRNPGDKITLMPTHNNGWDVTEWIGEFDESVNPECERTPAITRGIEMLTGINEQLPAEPQMKCLRKGLRGMQLSPVDLSSLAKYTIDARTGAVLKASMLSESGSDLPSQRNTWALSVNTHRYLSRDSDLETGEKITDLYWMGWGFSWETIPKRIYRAYRDRENRVMSVEGLPRQDVPCCLLRLDTERMEIVDSFEFPVGYLPRSPQFVRSKDPCPTDRHPNTHGYIVCSVLGDVEPHNPHTAAQDEIWIFHADSFKGKPIYRLSHPAVNLGLTIHSTWIPEIQFGKYPPEVRRAMRQKTLDRDYLPIVNSTILPHTRPLFHEIVAPCYLDQVSEIQLLSDWKIIN